MDDADPTMEAIFCRQYTGFVAHEIRDAFRIHKLALLAALQQSDETEKTKADNLRNLINIYDQIISKTVALATQEEALLFFSNGAGIALAMARFKENADPSLFAGYSTELRASLAEFHPALQNQRWQHWRRACETDRKYDLACHQGTIAQKARRPLFPAKNKRSKPTEPEIPYAKAPQWRRINSASSV